MTLPFPLCSLRSFVTRFLCGERFTGAAVSQIVSQIYGPALDGGRRIFPPETAQIHVREKVVPVDQVGLFLRGETVRKLLDDIGHEEVIDVNVTDVWDEKIFDPLPLAAEHTAQIRHRIAIFRPNQRKNFSCHRLCRAVLGDRLDGVEEWS